MPSPTLIMPLRTAVAHVDRVAELADRGQPIVLADPNPARSLVIMSEDAYEKLLAGQPSKG